jgi:hypothetical protein
MRERLRHIRDVAKWWWALVAALWSTFWIADSVIEKWGSATVKTWWDAHTQHFPTDWQTWLIGLLVIALLLILEGSYQHSECMAKAASAEASALRELAASLKEELRIERDRSKPHFSLLVGRNVTVPAQESLRKAFGNDVQAVVLIELVITNTGAPSITSAWECEVKYQGRTIKGEFFIHTSGSLDFDGRIKIVRSDFIQEKSDVEPIKTGTKAVGWAGLIFRDITKDQLVQPETAWIISCADIFGGKWSVEHHPSGRAVEKLSYIPGGVVPKN